MNKAVVLALAGMCCCLQAKADHGVLTTKSWNITIAANCKEGVVDCDDIDYLAVNRKSGKKVRLKGKDLFHYCPGDEGDGPGKTPCRHLGFEFRKGAALYRVWDDGNLEVRQGSRLLLQEKGEWE
jgi:hypothetical protein